jgi:hypothetical protein
VLRCRYDLRDRLIANLPETTGHRIDEGESFGLYRNADGAPER